MPNKILYFFSLAYTEIYILLKTASKGFYDYVDFGGHKTNDLIDHPLKKVQLGLERNRIYSVFMTHVSDDGSFDLVQKESENTLQHIAELLNSDVEICGQILKKTDVTIGNYCATMWPRNDGGDDLIYRAQIVAKRTFGEYHVRFIDYGNTTVKHESKLFYLPEARV